MSYTLEFQINTLTTSPNQLLGAHWTTRKRHADKWQRLVWAKVWHLKPPKPLAKAKVTLIRQSVRKMDADNARSSFKPVVDALVKWGIIADDSVDVIGEPVVIQEKAKLRESRIIVKVEGQCEV